MENKKTRGVNFENVKKLLQYLKTRKVEPFRDFSVIEWAKKNNWTESQWKSYDGKCE